MSELALTMQSKAKVRLACPQEYKALFPHSDCLLSISVGKPKHEGEKLKATVEHINQSFKSCTIMLADSLQRNNMKIFDNHSSKEELYHRANQAGHDWIVRNSDAISQLSIPYNIVHWDEWLSHPKFKQKKLLIDELHENNKDFRMALFETIKSFITRMENNNSQAFDRITAYHYCTEYLKEESAVILLFAEKGFKFELYPGKRPLAVQILFDKLIKELFPEALQWVEIKFV